MMNNDFNQQARALYQRTEEIINTAAAVRRNHTKEPFQIEIPQDFKEAFFSLIDKVNLGLMEDADHFFGYFLFQMVREIRFDIASPSSVNFKGAKYVIYFNPLVFLTLSIKQMESTIKHEILHILSLHLVRAKALKGRYSTLAVNMAMDVVVNQYLDYLPPYAVTLEHLNTKYALKLEPYEAFEYYAEKIQTEIDLQEADRKGEEDDSQHEDDNENEAGCYDQYDDDRKRYVETAFDSEKTHALWKETDEVDEKTLQAFTEKLAGSAQKGTVSASLEALLTALKKSKGELPWHLYLNRLMGTIESNKKKTLTRRSRRQPERLDLRGELRNHKAEVAVALDISGSISDEEFRQAIKEVLHVVKNYHHEITIIECDNQIRRTYKAKSVKDVKERMQIRGGTRFTPVFEYANKKKFNLLVYFTDGKGEEKLQTIPRGYKTLWVISGRGDQLSLKEPYGAVKKLRKTEIKESRIGMSDTIREGYSMNNQEPLFKVL